MSKLTFFAIVGISYIAWGTVQTISIKWADALTATDRFGIYTYSFAHPFVQALIMFISESLCLVALAGVIGVKKHLRGELIEKGKDIALPCNPLVWMLPAGADFLASILQNVGLTLTYASVYQMLRGAVVIFIAALSYVWLGRRFTRLEYTGIVLVALGLTLVGVSSIYRHSSDKPSGANRNPLLGNILIITAQVLHAYQGVCEERLFQLYSIPPLQMVGTEGVYGIGMALMLLAFLQLVPTASFSHNVRGSLNGNGVANTTLRAPFDDVILAFDQMRQCSPCLYSMLLYIAAGFCYNTCQLTIIKHFSAAACVMLGSLRNVTVWIVALAIPSIFEEHFDLLQLTGFLCLLLGNVLFQRVIPEEWWGRHFPFFVNRQFEEETARGPAATDLVVEPMNVNERTAQPLGEHGVQYHSR